jgi:hypothetical protein
VRNSLEKYLLPGFRLPWYNEAYESVAAPSQLRAAHSGTNVGKVAGNIAEAGGLAKSHRAEGAH